MGDGGGIEVFLLYRKQVVFVSGGVCVCRFFTLMAKGLALGFVRKMLEVTPMRQLLNTSSSAGSMSTNTPEGRKPI